MRNFRTVFKPFLVIFLVLLLFLLWQNIIVPFLPNNLLKVTKIFAQAITPWNIKRDTDTSLKFYYGNTQPATIPFTITTGNHVGIGTVNPTLPLHVVTNNTSSAPLLLESSTNYDTFSLIPHNGRTYLSFGIYYKNGAWVHDSTNSSNALFVIQPDSGAYWYDSNNSTFSWNVASNVQLWTAAGVLTGASSRSLKENFTPLNPDEILEKISQLDVSQWNYKSEGPSVTHIGPTSEDFYQLFKTGDSDKTIGLIDESGVALAGVKGLIEKTKTQQQQIDKLQEKIDVLEKEIQQLKNR